MSLRVALRLIQDARSVESGRVGARYLTLMTQRFEETIGDRVYAIEVMPVSNRWRAQLVRKPGIPTAMMPFYGGTPDEAARNLTDWLTLAHRRQASSAV